MEPVTIVISIVVIALIVFIIFRKYVAGMFYDYVVDAGLSFLDEIIGLGVVGLDIGDWLAAIIIFSRERKVSGNLIAALVAWEATNFFPVSLIPVAGEAVEIITNLFPAVTLSRVLFSKYSEADQECELIEKEIEMAEKNRIKLPKVKEVLKKMKKELEKGNPVIALEKKKELMATLRKKLLPEAQKELRASKNMIISLTSQDISGPKEKIDLLAQSIHEAKILIRRSEESLNAGLIIDSIISSKKARGLIESSVVLFNN